MIYHSGDVYLDKNVNIIFNPVGVRDNNKGFLRKVKKLFPCVYEVYKDDVWYYNEYQLIGEIQLVFIENKQLMMNGFCIDKTGKINKLSLAKTLVELCNLAYEYDLSVGIEYALGVEDKNERKWIQAIIKEVFKDTDIEVHVFDRKRKE